MDPHMESPQTGTVFAGPVGHAMAHAPQFCGSIFVFVQESPHRVVPPTHASPHCPAEHTSPAGHALPHPPQFFSSKLASTHAPPHFVVPPTHASPHCPTEHTWSIGHTLPHAPQFDASFAVFTHASPHFVVPPTHVSPHCPTEHTWSIGHTLPHAPQFAGSCFKSTHCAPHGSVPGPHSPPPLDAWLVVLTLPEEGSSPELQAAIAKLTPTSRTPNHRTARMLGLSTEFAMNAPRPATRPTACQPQQLRNAAPTHEHRRAPELTVSLIMVKSE